jgi:hypothetical protein
MYTRPQFSRCGIRDVSSGSSIEHNQEATGALRAFVNDEKVLIGHTVRLVVTTERFVDC